MIRRIGAGVLALAAVIIWFAMAPGESDDRSRDISSALSNYERNEARTEGERVGDLRADHGALVVRGDDEADAGPRVVLGAGRRDRRTRALDAGERGEQQRVADLRVDEERHAAPEDDLPPRGHGAHSASRSETAAASVRGEVPVELQVALGDGR